MYCPLLSSLPNSSLVECLGEHCAWWNDYFGMCALAVSAYERQLASLPTEERRALMSSMSSKKGEH
jgi:hypothetical protein